MKKTYSEIIEILKSNFDNINFFIDEYYDEYFDDYNEYDENGIKKPTNYDKHIQVKSILGKWKEIYISGGSDKGTDWVRVFYFEDHDVYLRVSGYYSSYEGVEFNDPSWDTNEIKEVRPKEVIRVIYE